MKMPLILAAAALVATGCDRQQETADSRPLDQSKDTIQESARTAKSQIEQEAEAKKAMVEAEAKSAQARIDAEKARAEATASEAQSKVESATDNIRNAGAAGERSATEVGTAEANRQQEQNQQQRTTATPPTPTPPAPSTPSASTTEGDQKLVEQVRAAVAAPGADASTAPTVQITANNGVVTLKGNVKSDAEKTRMETAAKAVPGVSKVENEIEVKSE
jgi:osmotically-inducible protein OsmY